MTSTFTAARTPRVQVRHHGCARRGAIRSRVPRVHRARAPRVGAPSADARTYRRRRLSLAGVLVVVLTFVGAAVSGTLAGSGGVPASATGAQPSFDRATVVVRSGDTLWSIAHAHRGEVAHHRYLDELVMLNGGASIQVGQRLVLP